MAQHGQIPAMTGEALRARLTEVGAGWRGLGCAVECGSWLGASACALAEGLVRAGYDRTLHLFDQWRASESEVAKASAGGVEIQVGDDLSDICRRNVEAVYPVVVCHRGRIERARWHAEPIEIFILDAAKRDPAFSAVMRKFTRRCVVGATIGLLDYAYWKEAADSDREAYRCQPVWACVHCGELGEVEDLGGVPSSSARFFRVLKAIEVRM
jgi:hypothetical protein